MDKILRTIQMTILCVSLVVFGLLLLLFSYNEKAMAVGGSLVLLGILLAHGVPQRLWRRVQN